MFDLFGIKKARRRREMWERVAAEHGGVFRLAQGFWKRTNERIEATVGGIAVVLDTYVVSSGNTSTQYTRVAAPFARGPGPKLKIYREGVLASLGKAIGMDDVSLGHVAFDAQFMVRTTQPAVSRRLWTDDAMARMHAHFPEGTVTSTLDRIELVTTGTWDEELQVRHGLALISQLAARDLYGLDAMRAVGGATVVQTAGEPPLLELDTGVRVEIFADPSGASLVTIARIADEVTHEPCTLTVVDGKPAEPERAARLPQGAHVALRSVGTGTLQVDGRARFVWAGIEEDPARLRAAAELLGAIAVEAGGVYR